MQKHVAAGVATAIVAPSLAPLLGFYYVGHAAHIATQDKTNALRTDDDPSLWDVFIRGFVSGLAYWGAWYLWYQKANT